MTFLRASNRFPGSTSSTLSISRKGYRWGRYSLISWISKKVAYEWWFFENWRALPLGGLLLAAAQLLLDLIGNVETILGESDTIHKNQVEILFLGHALNGLLNHFLDLGHFLVGS